MQCLLFATRDTIKVCPRALMIDMEPAETRNLVGDVDIAQESGPGRGTEGTVEGSKVSRTLLKVSCLR